MERTIITIDSLKKLAKCGKVPTLVIFETTPINGYTLRFNPTQCSNFHVGDKIVITNDGEVNRQISALSEIKNIFEKAYVGYHLVLDFISNSKNEQVISLTITKTAIDYLTISDDYKLVTEKMEEVEKVRKLIEETKEVQKTSAERINSLFKKVEELKSYCDGLKLDQTHKEQFNSKLSEFNNNIQELETRLKKDIPELDKDLDINNFR